VGESIGGWNGRRGDRGDVERPLGYSSLVKNDRRRSKLELRPPSLTLQLDLQISEKLEYDDHDAANNRS
jgi:hypothetical protein